MIYLAKPHGFKPKFFVSGVFLEVGERFLLLLRPDPHPKNIEPGKYGMPAGGGQKGETPLDAAVRELGEESGIWLHGRCLEFLPIVYAKYPHANFAYHMFRARLTGIPHVILSNEHTGFIWVTPRQALCMRDQLMQDLDGCIELVYGL